MPASPAIFLRICGAHCAEAAAAPTAPTSPLAPTTARSGSPTSACIAPPPAAPENARKKLLGDPQVIFEVLSPSTFSYDQKIKLAEYCALAGTHEVILVDPDEERIHLVQRTPAGAWIADWLAPGDDLTIPSLGVTIPRTKIFARD